MPFKNLNREKLNYDVYYEGQLASEMRFGDDSKPADVQVHRNNGTFSLVPVSDIGHLFIEIYS